MFKQLQLVLAAALFSYASAMEEDKLWEEVRNKRQGVVESKQSELDKLLQTPEKLNAYLDYIEKKHQEFDLYNGKDITDNDIFDLYKNHAFGGSQKFIFNNCPKLTVGCFKYLPDNTKFAIIISVLFYESSELGKDKVATAPIVKELRQLPYKKSQLSLTHMPSLKNLYLSGYDNLSEISLSHMPALQTLEMNECDKVSHISLFDINVQQYFFCTELKSLESTSISQMNSLAHLSFRDCSNLRDLKIENTPKLEILDLRGCDSITEEAIDVINRTYPKLEIRR